MSAGKRTKQPTAFEAPPVLTGKRKRATVSYVEVDGDIDIVSNDEDPKPVEDTTTIESDEDETFSTSRKVCCSTGSLV